jgi:hypothetical protein
MTHLADVIGVSPKSWAGDAGRIGPAVAVAITPGLKVCAGEAGAPRCSRSSSTVPC